jgi:hypothetical protein
MQSAAMVLEEDQNSHSCPSYFIVACCGHIYRVHRAAAAA